MEFRVLTEWIMMELLFSGSDDIKQEVTSLTDVGQK